jgi:H+/Cl- antiporter ClcA
MTRSPGLVGPLMLAALVARWASALVMPEPLYHLLARGWINPPAAKATHAPSPASEAAS